MEFDAAAKLERISQTVRRYLIRLGDGREKLPFLVRLQQSFKNIEQYFGRARSNRKMRVQVVEILRDKDYNVASLFLPSA